ncbi:MAG: acetoacetate decarboxylase family protein [Gammaproteobacteria bacterium]
MNPYDPNNLFHLSGTGVMRYMTLSLPTDAVRRLLPNGIELLKQDLTPVGTHPVMMGFHDMFRLHTSFPSLLPSMTYHEHSVGVPFCAINHPELGLVNPGPFFYMPIVMLDHLLATLGGLMFWGFAKRYARISGTNGRYDVAHTNGEPVLSLSYEAAGDSKPLAEHPEFELQRQALAQTVVSTFPLGMGPYFVLSDFPKHWAVATLQPLTTTLEIFSDYVLGIAPGRYPPLDTAPGTETSVLGAYMLNAPWRLSSPYPAMAGPVR